MRKVSFQLGTDQLGRDIASRLLYGARISLFIGVVVVASAGIFGTCIGLVAGYVAGLVDESLMRLTEVFLADKSSVIFYHGSIDDSKVDPKAVKHQYVAEALDQRLAGQPVAFAQSEVFA